MKRRVHRSRTYQEEKPVWDLCLYVADRTPRALMAIKNLNAFREKWLSGRCRIEVIDVCADPQVTRKDNIVALPTLVRKSPQPVRRVIGTLSDMERVVSGLGIKKECA